MRYLRRFELPAVVQDWLESITQKILTAEDRPREAARQWKYARDEKNPRHAELLLLRGVLSSMASGRQRCMYCEDNEGGTIDHFRPQADYPEWTFVWANHLLACGDCNQSKWTQFPLQDNGEPALIDPTAEDPANHLQLTPSSGEYRPLSGSAKAADTIRVFRLNLGTKPRGRRDAWLMLVALIERYGRARRERQDDVADEIRRTICDHSFSAVFEHLLRIAMSPNAERFIDAECLRTLGEFPELMDCLAWPAWPPAASPAAEDPAQPDGAPRLADQLARASSSVKS